MTAKLVNLSFTSPSASETFSTSFTVLSATNRKLVVGFANDSLVISIDNVRWGGQTGTKLRRIVLADVLSGTRPTVEFWELRDPAVGTRDLYWEIGVGNVGAAAHHVVIMEITSTDGLDIVDFALLADDPEVAQSALRFKVPAGSMVIDLIAFANSTVSIEAAGDLNELWRNVLSGNHVAASSIGVFPNGGDIIARWEESDGRLSQIAHAAIVLKPAVAGYGNDDDGYVGLTIPTLNVASGTNLGVEALQFGSGRAVLAMGNVSVVPKSLGHTGGILFVQSGHLKFMGALGTVTTVASA